MSKDEPDNAEEKWTSDHHLVGKTHKRNLVVPSEYDGIYVVDSQELKAAAFQPDDPRQRKPALWRSVVRRNNAVALGVDHVAADWQRTDGFDDFPTKQNQARATERLQNAILDRIYEVILPDLVLKAALEEVRSHFFRQMAEQANDSSSANQQSASKTKTTKKVQTPPLYYLKHPNTYLQPPQKDKSQPSTSTTIQFTPSSLVNRIKTGCSMAWSVAEERRRPALESIAAVASSGSDRRSSSRIARNSTVRDESESNNNDDLKYTWGVTTGGTIASFLVDQLLTDDEKSKETNSSQPAMKEDPSSETNGEDQKMPPESIKSDAVDRKPAAEDDSSVDTNPFLQPSSDAILEWLGKKTAKHLTTSEVQKIMPELMLKFKGKKKRKNEVPLASSGRKASPLISSIDVQIWEKVVSPMPKDEAARFVLECVSHDDISDIGEWEIGYFARAQLSLRLVSDMSSLVSNDPNDDYDRLDREFKDRKQWETTRYKAIHSGRTVWPIWADAFDEWKKRTINLSIANESGNDNDEDGELAKVLAAEEEPPTQRRRTARRGADNGGVFYGTQSNLSLKQLMDALLRILSPKSFGTVMDLLETVPDDSTDPMRRMRNALGRLVWKRSQMDRMVVNAEWTDASVWKRANESGLLVAQGAPEDKGDDVSALIEYIRELHQTELQLRGLILKHLANLPVSVIACAGDEKAGSMETMDHASFEDADSITWERSGHELVGADIFRPSVANVTDGLAKQCFWYRVVGYSPSVTVDVEEDANADKPQIGIAKENRAVERRIRFQAIPWDDAVNDSASGLLLKNQIVLTHAQVVAGMKAADVENSETVEEDEVVDEHPFAGKTGSKITLIPEQENGETTQISGTVAGWDSACDADNTVVYQILVLPEKGQKHEQSFRASLALSDNGFSCTMEGSDEVYSLQQFDYHPSSEAFKECRGVIGLLERHSKASPFLEPVDPIALNIPTYFDVIKHPMDIRTLTEKLDRGEYSNIDPRETSWASPVARMLNGPFLRDVNLIFDNAMEFNPADDWIHQAALSLKKYVGKKIEQISAAADRENPRHAKNASVYVDDDSDVDMYEYESDKDDDFEEGRQSRKRRAASNNPSGEDAACRAIERVVRLQKVLGDTQGQMRGTLAKLPISCEVSKFSLPAGWTCTRGASLPSPNGNPQEESPDEDDELSALVSLRASIEVKESSGLRRSTRSHLPEKTTQSSSGKEQDLIFSHSFLQKLNESTEAVLPRNRFEVEIARERLHEEHFAKMYQALSNNITPRGDSEQDVQVGMFTEGCFPPFLGRVTPSAPSTFKGDVIWEIGPANVIPAIRWVIRGLILSGHLSEVEPMTVDSLQSGAVLPNNAYYINPSAEPFDVLHTKEMQRRKRAEQEESEESEDEVEMSEYEKRRAERVARNADRLKLLGLT